MGKITAAAKKKALLVAVDFAAFSKKKQIRYDISLESSAGIRFMCNIIPYLFSKNRKRKNVAKFVVCCSRDWGLKG